MVLHLWLCWLSWIQLLTILFRSLVHRVGGFLLLGLSNVVSISATSLSIFRFFGHVLREVPLHCGYCHNKILRSTLNLIRGIDLPYLALCEFTPWKTLLSQGLCVVCEHWLGTLIGYFGFQASRKTNCKDAFQYSMSFPSMTDPSVKFTCVVVLRYSAFVT